MGATGTYLLVRLNNVITRAFIDSGCLCLATVSPRILHLASNVLPVTPRPVAQVVGQADPPYTRSIACFDFHHKELREDLWAYVLPDQSEDLILGQRWLTDHEVSLVSRHGLTVTALPKELPANAFRTLCSEDQVAVFAASPADIAKALDDTPKPVTPLPTWLEDLSQAFEPKRALELPPHRPGVDLEIRLKDGKHPQPRPVYSMSRSELLVLQKTLRELLAAGRIQDTKSDVGAPVLFAKKPGGGLRFCVDYRALNDCSEKDAYPLPLIQDTLRQISSAKYVSKLDVIAAFHRIRLAPGSEPLTAFRTPLGAFEYTVVPFGLTNAPAAFQRYINHVLRQWLGIHCMAYIDDCCIYGGETLEDHRNLVRDIVKALDEAGLQLDAGKCAFAAEKIRFLGFLVGPGLGIEADPEKTTAIRDWEQPKTLRGLRAFLGFANFYRDFVPWYSDIAAPLTSLTKKDTPFVWTEDCTEAFENLKAAFASPPVLAPFEPTYPTEVSCDSSGYAYGAELSQRSPEGILRPVAFLSKKMTPEETDYKIHDKEMLAVYNALRHWRHMLLGVGEFIVWTDHRNLTYFQKRQTLVERQSRWFHELSEFDFRLRHRPDTLQTVADALSRRPQVMPQDASDERLASREQQALEGSEGGDLVMVGAVWSPDPDLDDPTDRLVTTQDNLPCPFQDPELVDLWRQALQANNRWWMAREAVQNGERSFPADWGIQWQISECTVDERGLLRWRDRLWIPRFEPLRTRLIQKIHDSPLAGHPGRTATRDLVSREYAWPGLTTDVRRFVSNCVACGKGKVWREQKRGLLKPLPVPLRPWSELATDFIGPLPPSRGFTSILGVTDRLTKSQILIPMSGQSSPDVANALLTHVFAHHGLPTAIVSDRGPQFAQLFWGEICRRLGIQRRLSTSFHPETDGAQERSNAEIEVYLRTFCCFTQEDWVDLLPQAQIALNNRTETSTGVSPFFATHGYHQDLIEPTIAKGQEASRRSPVRNAQEWLTKLAGATDLARASLAAAQEAQETAANRHRQVAEQFRVGDLVYLRTKNLNFGRPSKKLDWIARRYRVIGLVGSHAVKLDVPGDVHPVFHVSLIRRAHDDPLPSQVVPPDDPGPVSEEEAYGDPDVVEGEYRVEAIVATRRRGRGHQAKVKWLGNDDTTWEPLSHLEDTRAYDIFLEKNGGEAGAVVRIKACLDLADTSWVTCLL